LELTTYPFCDLQLLLEEFSYMFGSVIVEGDVIDLGEADVLQLAIGGILHDAN